MTNDYDVIISGGGMVGATLAAALGGSALRIALIDPQGAAPTHAMERRVSAITPASQAVFGNLGVWAGRLSDHAAPVEVMRVWEGSAVVHYDSADIGEPCLAWIVENDAMVAALMERLGTHRNVDIFRPAALVHAGISEEQVAVRLDDGRMLTARLLVGADGAGSRTRREAGIDWHRHDLAQTAMVAAVRTGLPHQRTAWQHFLPTGPLAFLPLRDPHLVSIVWSADSGRASELMAMDDEAFNLELQAAFGDGLGSVQLAGPRAAFPLALGFAHHYCGHRVALVGDAAHTVHPLAGQGVNLGILDAATLAEVLLAAKGRDPGMHQLLRRYERARKGADLAMQAVTGGFRYLFGTGLAPVRMLRQAGLVLADRLQPFKNVVMRRASGLSGDLPALARRSSAPPR